MIESIKTPTATREETIKVFESAADDFIAQKMLDWGIHSDELYPRDIDIPPDLRHTGGTCFSSLRRCFIFFDIPPGLILPDRIFPSVWKALIGSAKDALHPTLQKRGGRTAKEQGAAVKMHRLGWLLLELERKAHYVTFRSRHTFGESVFDYVDCIQILDCQERGETLEVKSFASFSPGTNRFNRKPAPSPMRFSGDIKMLFEEVCESIPKNGEGLYKLYMERIGTPYSNYKKAINRGDYKLAETKFRELRKNIRKQADSYVKVKQEEIPALIEQCADTARQRILSIAVCYNRLELEKDENFQSALEEFASYIKQHQVKS